MQRLTKGFQFLLGRALHFRGVWHSPMRSRRVTGPIRANLACGVVADGDDQVHVRGTGLAELVPVLAAQSVGADTSVAQHFQGHRVGLLVCSRTAAGRKGAKRPPPVWFRMASARMLRAELWVQRNSTLIGSISLMFRPSFVMVAFPGPPIAAFGMHYAASSAHQYVVWELFST